MLPIAVLFILTIASYFILKGFLSWRVLSENQEYDVMQQSYEEATEKNKKLKEDNKDLEKTTEETIALYTITKEICKTLDENKVFPIFKENIAKYISLEDCIFLKPEADLSVYQGDTILPLMMHRSTIGYLVGRGLIPQENEKFNILAQQFLLGLKRVLLYQRVQELAITDTLTQVFNRRYFMERLNEEIARSKKFKYKLSFLMVDIDHFKEFNDLYGHLVGDAILREVSKGLKDNIRQIDFMGRYGGEELCIALTETGKEPARAVAERIRNAIEQKRIRVYDENLKVTISIGIATFPEDATKTNIFIEKADKALYRAKEAGRNKVVTF